MECKLSIVRIAPDQRADSHHDVTETETMRLTGFDEAHGVEWSLTLKAKDGIPEEYKAAIRHQCNDTVIVTIGQSAQQSSLEGAQ